MTPVPPLWIGSRKIVGDFNHRILMDEMIQVQKADGATFFRITIDHEQKIIWCEGWEIQPVYPYEQAPHNPPMCRGEPL